MCYAAPELLLSFPSEITTGIDIWALACTIYALLGNRDLFVAIFNVRIEVLVDMVYLLGGKDKVPCRFWKVFWETRGGRRWFDEEGAAMSEMLQTFERTLDLEERIQGLRGKGVGGLGNVDGAMLRRVLKGGLVFEPKDRLSAEEIVSMLPKEWQ
jgi:serine/threonine protein kinase